MRQYFSTLIVCLSVFSAMALQAADVAEEGRSLIESMHAARQKLRSGVVHLRGVRDSFDPERSPPAFQFPVNADLAFDWPTGRLRYDAETVDKVASWTMEELAEADELIDLIDDRESEIVTSRLRSVLTSQNYACCTLELTSDERIRSASNVGLLSPHTEAAVPLVAKFHCFDVRSVGLFNFWEFGGQTHVMGYQLPDVYFHLCDLNISIDRLLRWPVIAVEREGELSTIRFRGDMTITLNESQGFTPVAYYDVRGTPKPNRINDTVASTVQWEQISDVWIPTNFMIELLDAKGDGSALRHTYTLEWSHVNQPIPQHYFNFTNFPDVPDQTPVYNLRNEEPILVGEWLSGEFVPVDSPSIPIGTELDQPFGRWWSRVATANAIIFCLLLGGTLAWRFFRHQPA